MVVCIKYKYQNNVHNISLWVSFYNKVYLIKIMMYKRKYYLQKEIKTDVN